MNILTDETFESAVKGNAKPVLVDIFTEWCPPCKMLGPIIEKLGEEYAGKVDFYKMDLDKNPKTGELFGVDRIPTVVLFINGEVKDMFVGLKQEDEIRSWINSKI
jgi:thioredoxin 1